MSEDELEQAYFDLVQDGDYDRLLSQLHSKWPRVPREDVCQFIQDASEEVVRRVKAGQSVTNLAGLIRTIADRLLRKYWDELQETRDAVEAMKRLAAHGALYRHDEESVARIQRAVEYVRSLLPKLDNENWQRTIEAMLDATVDGRQVENKDLAQLMGAKPDTVGKWKERAIARLALIVREEGYDSLQTVLHPLTPARDEHEFEDEEYEDD